MRDPPPLYQEWEFKTPRDDEKVYSDQKNKGNIIGRAYFLRADRPSFTGEIQRWLSNIPNSLTTNGDKKRISSKNLVYNSIAISTLVTGLLVLLAMEFAYYLTRVAQENEAKAVRDKLNTEQKLRSALERSRQAVQERQDAEDAVRIAAQRSEQAIQERQDAEDAARIAAQRSEQAIQERQDAEDAARAINQQAIQERQNAEDAARIATQRSEQAIQERQNAEDAARIATQRSEQAIQERQNAEDAARIATQRSEQAIQERRNAEDAAREAAEERELARQNAIGLYNSIEDSIEEKTGELEKRVEDLETENSQLKSDLATAKRYQSISEKDSHSESGFISFKLTEKNYYDQENKELILDILRNVHNTRENSRKYHILQDILNENVSSGNREYLENKIKNLFNDYRRMKPEIQSSLEKMGFKIIAETNHYKIRFNGDNRYVVTFSRTASDRNAGRKIARDICNLLL